MRRIHQLQKNVDRWWALACHAAGGDPVDPTGNFVAFSKDNPFVGRLNEAMWMLQVERVARQAGRMY